MVEFEYQPWRKIVIHEIVEFPLEYFLNGTAMSVPEGGRSPPLNWANGLVFRHQSMPPTEDVIKEQIQGTIHWNSLHFGSMQKFEKEIKRGRSVTVPFVDLSDHNIFGAMADWIRENHMKK